MPCRYYFWTLIVLFIGCATLFHRPSDFEKGLEFYQQSHFREAAKHFGSYYLKHPDSDTVLYYLYDCYRRLNNPERSVRVLEQLIIIGSTDENVYLNLVHHYRTSSRYKDLYKLLTSLTPPVEDKVNDYYGLTQRLYAEIISGATTESVHSDPMAFAVLEGYIPVCPDGKVYDTDTITNGNLIILLDRLVEPVYPQKFFRMENISNRSFLYLPYMRLVHLGIVEFDAALNPNAHALVTTAVKAVTNLKKRGLID